MPQLQIVDLSPIPRRDKTHLEKTLESFSDRQRETGLEQRETDALRDIYGKYQRDGQNIEDAIIGIQTRPGISPTSRVNHVNQLLQLQKYNNERTKKAQVDAEKAEKKAANQAIIRDLEQRRGQQPGSLAAYEDNPAMAAQITRPSLDRRVNQADRPIDEDQQTRINQVVDDPRWEKASLSQKQQLFFRAGVSTSNQKSIIDPLSEELKAKPGGKYEEEREKSIASYVTNALSEREAAEELEYTLDTAKKAIQGDVTGEGWEALVKSNPYGQLITGLTPDEATLQASNKKLLEGSKGIFGSRPTEREIFLLLNSMLPSIGKSKEANMASIYFIDKLNKLKIMHGDIVDDIAKQGYVPDIESQVNHRMKPIVQEFREELEKAVKAQNEIKGSERVKVKSPDGKIGYMTQSQIDKAREENVIFTPTK